LFSQESEKSHNERRFADTIKLTDADFEGANLVKANFIEVNLKEVNIEKANLDDARGKMNAFRRKIDDSILRWKMRVVGSSG
jgi:hypothetical protein